MQWAPDSTDLWTPDSERERAWAPDSDGHLTLIQAIDLFLAAKAAEGISPKTATWYRMILTRLGRAYDPNQVIDNLSAGDVRSWLLELRTTLAPVSVAGYVRALKAFGNWLQAEGLAEAGAFRSIRDHRCQTTVIPRFCLDTGTFTENGTWALHIRATHPGLALDRREDRRDAKALVTHGSVR